MTEKKMIKKKDSTTSKTKGIVKSKSKVTAKPKEKKNKPEKSVKSKEVKKTKSRIAEKSKSEKKVIQKITLLETIIEAIKDKKGKEIVSIDLRKLSSRVSDFFVVCHADTNVHVQAITRGVEENVRVFMKEKPFSKEGVANAQWVLLDYVSVVVHIMQTQYRSYYNLEGLWADAKIVKHKIDVVD